MAGEDRPMYLLLLLLCVCVCVCVCMNERVVHASQVLPNLSFSHESKSLYSKLST